MTTCNTVLEIRKGVAKTPGDAYSAEIGLDTLNLLDPQGFILDEWTMKYAGMKNAVWAESPLTPGRELIAGEDGNVTETMQIILSAPDMQTMGVMLSHLMRLRQDARDFQIESSIEPVYLVNRQTGEPGNRYALIRNLEVALKEEPVEDGGRYIRDFTLTIEREPYWRGLPPGANPKIWTYAFKGLGSFDTSAAHLGSGTDHLFSATIGNAEEFQTQTTFLTQDFVDIPAEDIPGDAPALLEMCVMNPDQSTGSWTIARDTRSLTLPARETGIALPRFRDFSCAATDSAVGADTSVQDDADGIRYIPRDPTNRKRGQITFATTIADAPRFFWQFNVPLPIPSQDINLLRGRYAIFVRGRQVNGNAGDTNITLYFLHPFGSVTDAFYTTGQFSLPVSVAGWPISYLGVVTIPPDAASYTLRSGQGLRVSNDDSNSLAYSLAIWLYAQRTTGAATVQLCDILLVPIDEACVKLTPLSTNLDQQAFLDNTGYFTHGKSEDYAGYRGWAGDEPQQDIPLSGEMQGQSITLTPGVDNRLYFLYENGGISNPTTSIEVRGNIVPRWIGVRSV